MSVCPGVCLSACLSVRTYSHVHVCLDVRMYVCMYTVVGMATSSWSTGARSLSMAKGIPRPIAIAKHVGRLVQASPLCFILLWMLCIVGAGALCTDSTSDFNIETVSTAPARVVDHILQGEWHLAPLGVSELLACGLWLQAFACIFDWQAWIASLLKSASPEPTRCRRIGRRRYVNKRRGWLRRFTSRLRAGPHLQVHPGLVELRMRKALEVSWWWRFSSIFSFSCYRSPARHGHSCVLPAGRGLNNCCRGGGGKGGGGAKVTARRRTEAAETKLLETIEAAVAWFQASCGPQADPVKDDDDSGLVKALERALERSRFQPGTLLQRLVSIVNAAKQGNGFGRRVKHNRDDSPDASQAAKRLRTMER